MELVLALALVTCGVQDSVTRKEKMGISELSVFLSVSVPAQPAVSAMEQLPNECNTDWI